MSAAIKLNGVSEEYFASDLKRKGKQDKDYFRLDPEFLSNYDNKKPNFGFNGLGELVFYRTYSRLKEDGTKESPLDTFARVVEGCYEIQRRYCHKMHIDWTLRKAQKSAKEMFQRMWDFKFLPPGRGLWIMGSEYMWDRGSAALTNCAFVSTKDIGRDFAEPFCFNMDMSMVGVGVGFDTKGAGLVNLQRPSDEIEVFVIPDSKEGWVSSLRRILLSYVHGGCRIIYDYSQIRPAGTPIKGFGGKCSGSGVLMVMLEEIRSLLDSILLRSNPVVTSVDILDIMNFIGKCVVAGNVRRTALLGLGNQDDHAYYNAKNPYNSLTADEAISFKLVTKRLHDEHIYEADILDFDEYAFDTGRLRQAICIWNKCNSHRWSSNNSIFAEVGMDYSECATRTAVNGEPGYVWMDNIRNYGRLTDGRRNNIDGRAMGVNPCFSGSAKLFTSDGYVSLQDLWLSTGMHDYNGLGVDPMASYNSQYIVNDNGVVKATNVYRTGVDVDLYRVTLDDNAFIDATNNHEFIVLDRVQKKVRGKQVTFYSKRRVLLRDLCPGDLIPLNQTTYFGRFHDPAYAELAGWCIGDGSLSLRRDFQIKAECTCYDGDIEDVLPHLRGLMLELYEVHNKSSHQQPAYAGWSRDQEYFNHDEMRIGSNVLGRLLRDDNIVHGDKHNIPNSIWGGTRETVAAFLRGLASADGFVLISDNGTISVRINQSDCALLQDCRLLLNQFCIASAVHPRKKASKQWMNDGKGGKKLYNRKANFELIISGIKQVGRFLDEIGFIQNWKMVPARQWLCTHNGSNNSNTGRYTKVKSIEYTGVGDTFCLTEPGDNQVVVDGYQVGQCGEQPLESHELCTLCETFPVKHENAADYHRTLKFAYLYAKTVTLLPTHNKKTNAVMLRNRRIGLSQSGIVEAFDKFGRRSVLKDFCDGGYKEVRKWDDIYSDWLCCPRSIKVTTVKPSGSVSLVAGVTAGIHHSIAPSKCYWRRIRLSSHSSLVDILRDAGYNIEPAATDPKGTVIVKFGIVSDIETVSNVSIWEQVKNAVDYQRYWSDNCVSVTIQFKSEESKQIADVLEAFETDLKSISFLPIENHGYTQPPYETARREEVEQYNSELKPIDFAKYINEDAIPEKYCDGDICQIDSNMTGSEHEEEVHL